jgi:hypothetical protein
VASFGQTHEAGSHVLGLDRRNDDRAIAEPPPKELPHDAQHCAPRPWRQPAHVIHVFVEAAQFFVDGRCTDRPRRGDAERAQHHEQMADRRMRFVPLRARRPPAHAARQMLVGETGGGNLVYVNQVEPFPLCPPEEMVGAAGIAADGLPRMPALDQVPPQRLDVRRVIRLAANAWEALDTICGIHRGLLETEPRWCDVRRNYADFSSTLPAGTPANLRSAAAKRCA